jgi:hypothetical protein
MIANMAKYKKIENNNNQQLLFDSSSVHIFFQRTGTDNSLSDSEIIQRPATDICFISSNNHFHNTDL